jgi:hypothetical protein
MTKYDDLVKALRTSIFRSGMTDKAADAIEALQAERDALAAEVERLREAILGATFMDSRAGTVHAAKQDWVDLAELWPVLADVHLAALEEGKDG